MASNSYKEAVALDHRLHRVLAMFRTVTAHMPCPGRNLEEHVHHLVDRIGAIGRGALYPVNFDGIDLELLVRDEILFHAIESDRIAVAGETVILAPKAGELMSLVIHELATNAVKHGALGQAQAKIRVLWEVSNGPAARVLHFEWREQGVRISEAARAPGFGITLVERLIARELQGEGTMKFLADGVCCAIRIPLADLQRRGG